MKTRIGLFITALLLLPLMGLLLSGGDWRLYSGIDANMSYLTLLSATLIMLFYTLLVNYIVKRLTGNSPLVAQYQFYSAISIASVVLCYLVSYLNLFALSWTPLPLRLVLFSTPLFATIAPAILITRALLGYRLIKLLTFPKLAFKTEFLAGNETLSRILLAVSLFGLSGGVLWPDILYGLLWSSPLLLLIALQLLWQEDSIFAALKTGDWARIICVALSGLIVGNLTIMSMHIIPTLLIQTGFVLFALTCLQLSDVIAQNWRGKTRSAIFAGKKKFPIPVVGKKA
jgi:hypothetical protein